MAHSKSPSAIMDIDKLIRELNADIDKLKRVVGCLEQLRGTSRLIAKEASAAATNVNPMHTSRGPRVSGQGWGHAQRAVNNTRRRAPHRQQPGQRILAGLTARAVFGAQNAEKPFQSGFLNHKRSRETTQQRPADDQCFHLNLLASGRAI
jgi:hypothetical protein